MLRIGLISDTHDLLRPQALTCLRGSDHILHAGDICSPAVLEALAALAPVTAVRGNNDRGAWSHRLETTVTLRLGGVCILLVHDRGDFDRAAAPPDLRVVVTGHSHKPQVQQRDGLLHVNPGSAGPRRFRLPVTVGELTIDGAEVSAQIVELPGT